LTTKQSSRHPLRRAHWALQSGRPAGFRGADYSPGYRLCHFRDRSELQPISRHGFWHSNLTNSCGSP